MTAHQLVDNLARPGANVTGLANFAVQLSAKRLEYLKAASKLGLTLLRIEARSNCREHSREW
jgi:hypothetical protein